jgi:hypothetical protein
MMSAWFTKSLGDAMLAGEALAELETLYLSSYGKSVPPNDTAIFIRHESEGHLHCEVKAYFSPAAVAVANKVDADPCAKPSRDGLSLLAGPEGCWQSLFPELDR